MYSRKNLCETKSSHGNADEEVNFLCHEAMLTGKKSSFFFQDLSSPEEVFLDYLHPENDGA